MSAVKFASVLLALLLLGSACTPAAQVASQRATEPPTNDIRISSNPLSFTSTLEITDFIVENEKLIAEGTFTVTDFDGNEDSVPVQLPVNDMSANESCTQITVTLGPLDLEVLGMSLNAQTLKLSTTSNPNQGFTGIMLCGIVESFKNADMNVVAKMLNEVLALFG